jgi:uncharacterized caspase-like protein
MPSTFHPMLLATLVPKTSKRFNGSPRRAGLVCAALLLPAPAWARTEHAKETVSYEAVALDQVPLAVEGALKLRLVILDACRDNPFAATMRRTVANRSVGRGLARVEPEGATLVVYAAKDGQVAQDGDGTNSPFATALVKYIETPGLEINFLFRRVRDDVINATGRRQEPFVNGSLPAAEFYFRLP